MRFFPTSVAQSPRNARTAQPSNRSLTQSVRRTLRVLLLVSVALAAQSVPAAAQIVEVRRPLTRTDHSVAPTRDMRIATSQRFCSLNRSVRLAERTMAEFVTAGQLTLTGQLVRLCLGEPKVFTLPLYFLVGADAAATGQPSAEERSTASLLLPTAGSFNLQITNANRLWAAGSYTELSVAYQAGVRYNRLPKAAAADQSEPTLSGDLDAGLRFQTGAWDLDDPEGKAGVLWVQVKMGLHLVSDEDLVSAYGVAARNPSSLSIEGGIEIEDRISLKGSWSKVLNNDGVAGLKHDVVKLGVEVKAR